MFVHSLIERAEAPIAQSTFAFENMKYSGMGKKRTKSRDVMFEN